MSDIPSFTCSKSGDELLQIGQTLRSAVADGLVERERTPTGLRLRALRSPDTEAALREFIRREKECCPFFEFNVTKHETDLSLEVTGPPEASPLLDLIYQLAQPAAAG